MDEVVAPLLQRYVYGDVPPLGDAVAVPSDPPLHEAFVADAETERAGGAVRVNVLDVMQPKTSVTVTVYVPPHRLPTCAVVAPVFHEYVNGAAPAATTLILPSQAFAHVGLDDDELAIFGLLAETDADAATFALLPCVCPLAEIVKLKAESAGAMKVTVHVTDAPPAREAGQPTTLGDGRIGVALSPESAVVYVMLVTDPAAGLLTVTVNVSDCPWVKHLGPVRTTLRSPGTTI
jgi:hypothetical protein